MKLNKTKPYRFFVTNKIFVIYIVDKQKIIFGQCRKIPSIVFNHIFIKF